jgi:hypothetical protein
MRIPPPSSSVGTSGVVLSSAVPGSTPLEVVRAPRSQIMVEIIQQYTDISNTIERMAKRRISVQVDFPIDDFPRETAERLEINSKCDKYLHAMNVKDQLLWTGILKF